MHFVSGIPSAFLRKFQSSKRAAMFVYWFCIEIPLITLYNYFLRVLFQGLTSRNSTGPINTLLWHKGVIVRWSYSVLSCCMSTFQRLDFGINQ